ncbi:MAG TPA: ATP-binding protein [Thermohalobaculum sp.]|nr:ATP-binding protein [Thermohalobaculum sp.]
MNKAAIARKFHPSVAAILVIVNLVILLLPLASIFFFRVYENQLVRETENELIVQAAVLSAVYRQAIRDRVPDHKTYGRPVTPIDLSLAGEDYAPVLPQINLASDPVLPPRPDAGDPVEPPDQITLEIGEAITALFLDAQRATLAGMRLLDYRGVVIAGRGEVGRSLADVDEVRDALDGRHRSVIRERILDEPTPSYTSISRGTGIRIFVAYPVIEDARLWGVVYMSRTPNNILHHLYGSLYRLLAIGALILGLTLLIAWITSRTLLRPIRALSEQARDLAEGRRSMIEPLDHYGTRELAALGQSVFDMAAALEKRGQYVRDFATHVSHEFKTPLTSIRGAAELLGEHHESMGEEKRKRFLANIEADAVRLRSLVDRLNELARADNVRPLDESIDLVAAVRDLADEFSYVEAVVPAERSCMIRMSGESFRMIAGNMIQNAEQAGATWVRFVVECGDGGLGILISDNGRGVSSGNRDKIYEPFFTTRRESGGTGLGLGIVRSLVEAHNGTIELRESEVGATFALNFQTPAPQPRVGR